MNIDVDQAIYLAQALQFLTLFMGVTIIIRIAFFEAHKIIRKNKKK